MKSVHIKQHFMEEINKKSTWQECLDTIKLSVSPAAFSAWFAQTHITKLDDLSSRYSAEIGCASPYAKTTIETRYFGLVQDSLSKSLGKTCDITFIVKQNPQTKSGVNGEVISPLFSTILDSKSEVTQKVINSRLKVKYTFENYAVSSSNQMAWAAAEAVSDNPGTAYNPLFVWGGVGWGKPT